MVDLLADARERGAGVLLCFKCQTYADDFQGISKEDGSDAGEGAADEAAEGGFLRFVFDDGGANLLICKEFNGSIGEDTEEGGAVAAKEASYAILVVDIPHGGNDAKP